MTPTLAPPLFVAIAFVLGAGAGIVGILLARAFHRRGASEVGAERAKRSTSKRTNEARQRSSTRPVTKFIPPAPGLPNLGLDDDLSLDVPEPTASLVSYVDQLDPGQHAQQEPLHVIAAAQTDFGKRRRRNDDRYVVLTDEDEQRGLFAVVDGMGGHGGGAIASRVIAEGLDNAFRGAALAGSQSDKRPSHANPLVWTLEHANRTIFETAKETPELHGMGATVVAAYYDAAERRVYIAYVGDSRAYRLRRGRCELLTVDHTLAQEGPMAGYLRRAVGVEPEVKVDVVVGMAEPGDSYLLCTNGLAKARSNQEIAVALAGSDEPSVTASTLVDEASQVGGKDNIAVVVVRVIGRREAARRASAQPAAAR